MSSDNASTSPQGEPASILSPQSPSRRPPVVRHAATALAVVAVLGVGAVVGAFAYSQMRPSPEMAPATPVAINVLPNWGLVTVKGQVAEIFGNKFVVQDASGRALVETGRVGEGGKLVAKDESVMVQGRFGNGFIHATFVVHADGTTVAIGPAGDRPLRGPHGWLRHLMGEAQVLATVKTS